MEKLIREFNVKTLQEKVLAFMLIFGIAPTMVVLPLASVQTPRYHLLAIARVDANSTIGDVEDVSKVLEEINGGSRVESEDSLMRIEKKQKNFYNHEIVRSANKIFNAFFPSAYAFDQTPGPQDINVNLNQSFDQGQLNFLATALGGPLTGIAVGLFFTALLPVIKEAAKLAHEKVTHEKEYAALMKLGTELEEVVGGLRNQHTSMLTVANGLTQKFELKNKSKAIDEDLQAVTTLHNAFDTEIAKIFPAGGAAHGLSNADLVLALTDLQGAVFSAAKFSTDPAAKTAFEELSRVLSRHLDTIDSFMDLTNPDDAAAIATETALAVQAVNAAKDPIKANFVQLAAEWQVKSDALNAERLNDPDLFAGLNVSQLREKFVAKIEKQLLELKTKLERANVSKDKFAQYIAEQEIAHAEGDFNYTADKKGEDKKCHSDFFEISNQLSKDIAMFEQVQANLKKHYAQYDNECSLLKGILNEVLQRSGELAHFESIIRSKNVLESIQRMSESRQDLERDFGRKGLDPINVIWKNFNKERASFDKLVDSKRNFLSKVPVLGRFMTSSLSGKLNRDRGSFVNDCYNQMRLDDRFKSFSGRRTITKECREKYLEEQNGEILNLRQELPAHPDDATAEESFRTVAECIQSKKAEHLEPIATYAAFKKVHLGWTKDCATEHVTRLHTETARLATLLKQQRKGSFENSLNGNAAINASFMSNASSVGLSFPEGARRKAIVDLQTKISEMCSAQEMADLDAEI
jgi:hypothetical protein